MKDMLTIQGEKSLLFYRITPHDAGYLLEKEQTIAVAQSAWKAVNVFSTKEQAEKFIQKLEASEGFAI